MTSDRHTTGTNRCAEAVKKLEKRIIIRTVVNLQVDEPFIAVDKLDFLLSMNRQISTLITNFATEEDRLNRNNTKAVVSVNYRAHWFSRASLANSYHHIGVYSFPIEVLEKVSRLAQTKTSKAEGLEQLTWLESYFPIRTFWYGKDAPLSVNTQEDYEKCKVLDVH